MRGERGLERGKAGIRAPKTSGRPNRIPRAIDPAACTDPRALKRREQLRRVGHVRQIKRQRDAAHRERQMVQPRAAERLDHREEGGMAGGGKNFQHPPDRPCRLRIEDEGPELAEAAAAMEPVPVNDRFGRIGSFVQGPRAVAIGASGRYWRRRRRNCRAPAFSAPADSPGGYPRNRRYSRRHRAWEPHSPWACRRRRAGCGRYRADRGC